MAAPTPPPSPQNPASKVYALVKYATWARTKEAYNLTYTTLTPVSVAAPPILSFHAKHSPRLTLSIEAYSRSRTETEDLAQRDSDAVWAHIEKGAVAGWKGLNKGKGLVGGRDSWVVLVDVAGAKAMSEGFGDVRVLGGSWGKKEKEKREKVGLWLRWDVVEVEEEKE
ncbi:hypothetical protein CC80DRAFT_500191 [Byssothecium circinans]|uniref:Uncharacterized protein n=1 Tax=Byssothecium circinans TaxID=147558 RepID=A0A6A5UDN0_9PLEO|nr:hypothetical protein CC80DRAFT_500191 [Byssothecium circinans]